MCKISIFYSVIEWEFCCLSYEYQLDDKSIPSNSFRTRQQGEDFFFLIFMFMFFVFWLKTLSSEQFLWKMKNNFLIRRKNEKSINSMISISIILYIPQQLNFCWNARKGNFFFFSLWVSGKFQVKAEAEWKELLKVLFFVSPLRLSRKL